jgi:hypothetical protein
MPRLIDLIRASAVPASRMHAAARGALALPAADMMEILVHLANHNKIFGQQARLTLAGWDEASALAVASDPLTPSEVLQYMISPQNLRPCLLPALLENPSVSADSIIRLAESGSREVVGAISKSKRAGKSPPIQTALATNPNFTSGELPASGESRQPLQVQSVVPSREAVAPTASHSAAPHFEKQVAKGGAVADAVDSRLVATEAYEIVAPNETQPATEESLPTPEVPPEPPVETKAAEEAADPAITAYITEHAADIAAEKDKPFQAIGGSVEDLTLEGALKAAPALTPIASIPAAAHSSAASGAKTAAKKPHAPPDTKRDNTVQKISKLDVKGRIQLAMKGNKEERSLLIRDGTKIVALAVLESGKITDSEVEQFASQKNVLEAVLRAIPMKRRFAKHYAVLRNLVFNPRTPLDVSLGLLKHMLVQDLRNLSGNREVSETVRKLALKMFKQKTATGDKRE